MIRTGLEASEGAWLPVLRYIFGLWWAFIQPAWPHAEREGEGVMEEKGKEQRKRERE